MLKRIIAICLSLTLILCGCGNTSQDSVDISNSSNEIEESTIISSENDDLTDVSEEDDEDDTPYKYEPEFDSMDDEELLSYMEDNVYAELVKDLNDDGYFVENVDAIYVSKEYLEESAYNSQANIFFGYTLEDIENVYGNSKYVFTTSDEGKTVVEPFENYDDTYEQIIKNVAIGSGVILLCVTVSAVTGGAGAPAVSMIFAMSAETGTTMALSSAAFGGLAAGITTQMETGDVNKALKAAAIEGSEAFKWGAIVGTVAGGGSEAIALKGATLNGLTMNEAALIQKESQFPLELIKEFKSIDEYNVYKNAGLYTKMVNGRLTLVRDIDPDYVVTLKDGTRITNLELMSKGKAPFDAKTGQQLNLHHINQEKDGVLAILTKAEHTGNDSILHDKAKEGVHNTLTGDKKWNQKKIAFWKEMAQMIKDGAF